jgi:hypothetical protein
VLLVCSIVGQPVGPVGTFYGVSLFHGEDSATVTASVSGQWLSEGNAVNASVVASAVGVSEDRVSNVQLAPVQPAVLIGSTQQGMFDLA